ncbi:unnamed protein product [Discula destructiva]
MSAATPTKRRALGALDVNTLTRSPSTSAAKLVGKRTSPLKKTAVARHASTTPLSSPARKEGTSPQKRSLEVGDVASSSFKKLRAATASSANSPVKKTAAVVKSEATGEENADEEESPPASTQRSLSPDASSLFDNSTINTSQLTAITEPDATAPIRTTTTTTTTTAAALHLPLSITSTAADEAMPDLPPPRPRRVPPTREEFRQKAEILKLRLSLASYKVKTNQTDVPLDKLQVRPVPGMACRRASPLPSMSAHTIERATPVQYWYRSLAPSRQRVASSSQEEVDGESGDDMEVLPKVVGGMVTPPRKRSDVDDEDDQEEVRLTSSGLRGGAAKGLLSLSQASS